MPTEDRRRSDGEPDDSSCGSWEAGCQAPRPSIHTATPDSRCRRTAASNAHWSIGTNPVQGHNGEIVHAQTAPSTYCDPADLRSGWVKRQTQCGPPRLARATIDSSAPHGVATPVFVAESHVQAFSHSVSVVPAARRPRLRRLRFQNNIGDILHRLASQTVFDIAKPDAGAPVGKPELWVVRPVYFRYCQPRVDYHSESAVAAVVDEVLPFIIDNQKPAKLEHWYDDVGWALIVQRIRVAGGFDAQH